MGKLVDLTGNQYGEWTVLERAPKPEGSSSTSAFWLCRCSCGTERIMSGNVLKQGKSRSCGCKTNQFKLESTSEDLTNQRFGHLTVIRRAERPPELKSYGSYWLCRCDCGKEKIIMGKSLREGHTKTCGCHMDEYNNLIGQRYGKLVVVEREPKTGKWTCQCDCGNITYVSGRNLIHGNIKSCGCLVSVGEYNIEQLLKSNNISYTKQYSFTDLVGPNNGLLRFDFAIFEQNQLVRLVEFQGKQHYQNNEKYFQSPTQTDIQKKEYCIKNNIPLVCIPYWKRDNIQIIDILGDHYLIEAFK